MLERGRYGVEWTPPRKDEDPPILGHIVLIVGLVALISLGWTLVKRYKNKAVEDSEVAQLTAVVEPPPRETAVAPPPRRTSVIVPEETLQPPPPPLPTNNVVVTTSVSRPEKRPPKVLNLLMRLEEAEKARNVEMAITTIETLRALPGAPAADLDNNLARRLGTLNRIRLFDLKSAQWVDTVTVKSGDSASRIASEHGSTLASLKRLNGGKIDPIKVGQKLYVLNHPRFNLVVKLKSQTADLQLNGKFFKRYDLETTAKLVNGAFEWREVSLPLKATDRAELETLLPKTTSVLISEM